LAAITAAGRDFGIFERPSSSSLTRLNQPAAFVTKAVVEIFAQISQKKIFLLP
jgi:hypothetical protein